MAPITRESLKDVKVTFALASLGMHSSHTLEKKVGAMRDAGYKYVVVGFGQFMQWVRIQEPNLPASNCPPEWIHDDEPDPSDEEIWQALYRGAKTFKAYVESQGMQILILQPLSQYEGWQVGSKRSDWSREKAKRWLKLCAALGVTYLQVGSNDQPDQSGDFRKTCEDMKFLAELGAAENPPVNISYEPWCFSTVVHDWEGCWEVVRKVDHPNLGLCIDIAHIALAPNYGFQPLTGEGYTDAQFEAELDRLRSVPAEKLHYFEVSDVMKPRIPLLKGSEYDAYHEAEGDSARVLFTWSILGRCIPLVGKNAGQDVHGPEDYGSARVIEVTKAVFSTGFRGPCAWEIFEHQYMSKDDPTVPSRYAKAGLISKEKLFEAIVD